MSNYLVSYPRSGNTLLRFIIEYITSRPVAGCEPSDTSATKSAYRYDEINLNGSPVFVKSHGFSKLEIDQINFSNSKYNLLIRDYYYAITSQMTRGSIKDNLLDNNIKMYSEKILWYDQSRNKGSLIYYEDLINLTLQPSVIDKLLSENNVEMVNWKNYLDNIEEVNLKSSKGYAKFSKQDRPKIDYDLEKDRYFVDKIKSILGSDLFEKYLSRYVR